MRVFLFLFFILITQYAISQIDSNRVLYYEFDGDAQDLSGNNKHGAIFDTVTYDSNRFGVPNSCIRFESDHPDQFTYHPCVRVPELDEQVNFATGSFTISIWAKSNSARRMHLFSIDTFPGYNKNLNFDFNDFWGLWLYWNSQGQNRLHSGASGTFSDGKWHNYILRRDKNSNTIDLFIDGDLKQSQVYTDTICNVKSIYVGQAWGFNRNYPWIGSVDELMIWKRAITIAEVLQINNKPATEISRYSFAGDMSDLYGNNENVTPVGGELTEDRYGRPNNAYRLNGKDYLVINPLSDPSFFNNNFTISMWLRTDEDSGAIVFSLEGAQGQDYNINMFMNLRIAPVETGVLTYTNSSVFFFPFTYQTLSGKRFQYSDRKWHHMAYQRKQDSVLVFLDGKRAGAISVPGFVFGSNNNNIYIGRHALFGVDQYKGDIDEISFHNTALSDSLIKLMAYDTLGFPKVYQDIIFRSPAPGANWAQGSKHWIKWDTDGSNNGRVVIRYAKNGINWTLIDTVPNSGQYLWTVNADTGGCYIRVDNVEYTYRYDGSSLFHISASQLDTAYHWQWLTDTADYAPRDGAGGLVFDNKMWLLGGWNPQDPVNFPQVTNSEVWNSTDGIDWTLVKDSASWEPRHTASYLVHDGKMIILGGDFIQNHYQNDVWGSVNGTVWDTLCSNVPWGNRVLQYAVSFHDTIWVMGGQNMANFKSEERFYNDIWKSADGISWTKSGDAPWAPRGIICGSVVFNDRIYLIGGGTYETASTPTRKFYSEVWTSGNGIDWIEIEKAPFNGKQYHNIDTFDNKIWVIGGSELESIYSNGNTNNVWYSSDGSNWYELPNSPFARRHAAATFVYNGCLYLVSGNNMQRDVWRLCR